MAKQVLLIIDPQEDFCSVEDGRGGALPVPGPGDDRGRKALKRVAKFIQRYGSQLDDVIVTLDCHNPLHIAHPIWYQDERGNPPPPFKALVEDKGEILIGSLDASGFHAEGKVRCRRAGFTKWTLAYLRALRDGGRYPHMLWNPHCLIGSAGGAMIPEVFSAVREWEEGQFGVAQKISKGSNLKTEHFGALRAEVVDPDDDSTQVNAGFLKLLSDPEITRIFGCGLARGHCLANTALDTAKEFDGDTFCQKFVLFEDGTADVGGLEFLGDKFVADFKARGMKTAKTTDF